MNIPNVFQKSYDSWYKKYIEETEDWVSKVNKNPFIAIESHIHEDPITDLLAHILQNDEKIKEKFIRFLLKKAKYDIEKITVTELRNTEIETQYSIKVTKSRLDLFIKIPNNCHIIIENKIFGAKEQKNQMERYIDGAKEIKEGTTVLAFYATPDGQGECKTARKYSVDVIPLAFYSDSDDPKEQTIYSVLSDVKGDHPLQELTQDFCFYLRYRFFNQQSVSFLQKHINIDLCSQKCFEELFKEGEYPIISKKINPYACPKNINAKNYFMQLLKVHALNRYLLKKFKKKDNCSYHAVFDGIRVKRQAKIGNTDCNVYFETKYDKNNFFMVITICSLNEIYKKNMKLLKDYWYKEQNELNEEFTYSLWLWIMDPKEIEERKDSILNLCKNYENYESYINFIFTNCMKKIFDAITEKKEIDKEALKHYKNYYRSFQQ